MLSAELKGEIYSKAQHGRALMPLSGHQRQRGNRKVQDHPY